VIVLETIPFSALGPAMLRIAIGLNNNLEASLNAVNVRAGQAVMTATRVNDNLRRG